MAATVLPLGMISTGEDPIGTAWAWLPTILLTGVAATACRRAATAPGLHPAVARLWRSLAVTLLLVGLAKIADARRWLTDPVQAAEGRRDLPTSLCLALALAVLLWALLRLPADRRGRRERTARFVLDALIMGVTILTFGCYAASRTSAPISLRTATVPALMVTLAGLIVGLALIKVAMTGLGGLDRGTVRWFVAAGLIGPLGRWFKPLLAEAAPGLGGGQLFTSLTMVCVVFAVDRQLRAAGVPPRPVRQRPYSVAPYIAVAATDGLLIRMGTQAGRPALIVALGAVALTLLVAARQIGALRENERLLQRVDQSLLELNDSQQELTHRATHDALTGLANRELLNQSTGKALAARNGAGFSLALIDLDDFKAVNDRLGHPVGDALLVAVAARLRGCLRADDLVARLGGDEFGLLLHNLTGSDATDVLDRIHDALHRPIHAQDHELLVRASIGLAESWPQATQEELLRRADLALYAAKDAGKGQHAVYDAELGRDQAADAQLGAELRQALKAGQLSLVYQPIVRLPDGAWTGLEALARWRHPVRGSVPPDVFIPVAERTGLILPLGMWILHTALRQFSDWHAEFGTAAPHSISVNVSARQLREPAFAADLDHALTRSGVRPDQLIIDVTETVLFENRLALKGLHQIAEMGVQVALDDFGTGHSSLGLLRTVPAGTVKVDKSFIDGIGGHSAEAVIATALLQIAQGLHLNAVAEGVETEAQATTLHRLGYRLAQGYHFSRPLPSEQIHHHLANDTARQSA